MVRTGDQDTLGGQGVILLYRLNSSHVLKQADNTTNATTIAHASLDMGLIKNTSVQRQENGSLTVEIPHQSDGAKFAAFLEVACPPGAATTSVIESTLEDGTIRSRSKTGGTAKPEYLAVFYPSDLTVDGQKCVIFPCTVAATSGSYSTSADAFTELSFQLIGIKAKDAIALLPAMHIAALTAISTNLTVLDGAFYKEAFITAPA